MCARVNRHTRLASRAHVAGAVRASRRQHPRRGRQATVSSAPTSKAYRRSHSDMAAAHTHPAPAPTDRRPDGRAGSRRIFPPQFKLQVLEAYRRDAQCRGNQRATARKFGIHRRQIQKWLQAEPALRATLLRRAPQPAPSPPPYAAGSPESARLPSPPPPTITFTTPIPLPTSVPVLSPIVTPIPLPPSVAEPIDLSFRRLPSPPPPVPTYAPEPPKKPFKLFRPYLLDEEESEDKPAVASLPVMSGVHVSAFVPLQSAALCAGGGAGSGSLSRWCAPAFAAPLR